MAFGEKKISKKEQKELEAQQAREQAEWDAKFAAKQEKRKIGRLIEEVEKTEKEIMENAAAAKAKGYADVYRQQLSALKVARARKVQAEKFLFQIDSMEKMKSIADSSTELLNSMGAIMNTLGKLSIDKDKMRQTQKDFMQTQQNLSKQSMSIEQFFGQMEMMIPEDDEMMLEDDGGTIEAGLEDEIQAILNSKTADGANVDSDVARFQQMLNS